MQQKPDSYFTIYDDMAEFLRQGIDIFMKFRVYNNQVKENGQIVWRIPSYPTRLILPKDISDSEVCECIKYRKEGRIPALTYHNQNTNGTLWRCSQPKSGILGNQIKENTKLFMLIAKSCKINEKQIAIYDARPYINALGNKLKGGGYENASDYHSESVQSTHEYQNLENINSVRNSYELLLKLCNSRKCNLYYQWSTQRISLLSYQIPNGFTTYQEL